MFATTNGAERVPVYRCRTCYRVRRRDLVDEVILAAVVARLSRPDAIDLLHEDIDITALRERVVELRERRDGLAMMLAEGLLARDAVRTQATRLTEQIADLGRHIDDATGTSPLATVITCADVGETIAAMPLLKLREIIRTLMEVRILSAGKGVRFSPEQVAITWRGIDS